MPQFPDIVIDYNNIMADVIGPDNGINADEVSGLEDAAEEIHKGLLDLKSLGQLKFSDLPYQDEVVAKVMAKAKLIRGNFETVVVLGIGGSALGARSLFEGLLSPFYNQPPRLLILDNIDPVTIEDVLEHIKIKKSFFIVISKSGGTTEALAQFAIFKKAVEKLKKDKWRENFLVITDPNEGPLREMAVDERLMVLDVPPGVGGRYSVLTPVGLLPAACAGINIKELLAGAARMESRTRKGDIWTNPAYISGALHYLAATKKGKSIRVLMPYSDRLGRYVDWFIQLWAESLGKSHTLDGREVYAGSTPIKAVGATDQHAQLQLYIEGPADKVVDFFVVDIPPKLKVPALHRSFERVGHIFNHSLSEIFLSEKMATEYYLASIGRPSVTYRIPKLTAHAMGQLMFLAELETVFAGELWNINPFNQPGVEKSKKYIAALLGKKGSEKEANELKGWKKLPKFMV